MQDKPYWQYLFWLVVGIICFGLSLAGGYWFTTRNLPQDTIDQKQAVDNSSLPVAEVFVPEMGFEDIEVIQTEKVQEVVEFLRTTFPAEVDREVNKVSVKRIDIVKGKEEYQLFQAADETDYSRVTMGCNWRKEGNEAVIELYLDQEFMKQIESAPELKDKTLRGVAFCVLSATTTPKFNEARQEEMLVSMYKYLGEQGWAILGAE